jgi:hypothetical protein
LTGVFLYDNYIKQEDRARLLEKKEVAILKKEGRAFSKL